VKNSDEPLKELADEHAEQDVDEEYQPPGLFASPGQGCRCRARGPSCRAAASAVHEVWPRRREARGRPFRPPAL
jgi:hypothetical protein